MSRRSSRSLSVLALALAPLFAVTVPTAGAIAEEHDGGQGGPSTAGALVLAQDPGQHGDLRLTLTARVDAAAEPSASVLLRVDGVRILEYQVHRVAVGDTGCGGHEEVAPAEHEGVRSVVRGVAVLGGDAFGLDEGSPVQVWIDLRDRGDTHYEDAARVRIRPAPHGGESVVADEGEECGGGDHGWAYDSHWQPIMQVRSLIRPGFAP